MKKTGYRLHFEGCGGENKKPTYHPTMASVRKKIREEARTAGITIKQATECAYIAMEVKE